MDFRVARGPVVRVASHSQESSQFLLSAFEPQVVKPWQLQWLHDQWTSGMHHRLAWIACQWGDLDLKGCFNLRIEVSRSYRVKARGRPH